MGMAVTYKSDPSVPTCKNTVVCLKCHTEYTPNTPWVWGYDMTPKGSTRLPRYWLVGKVPKNVCPACGRANKHYIS